MKVLMKNLDKVFSYTGIVACCAYVVLTSDILGVIGLVAFVALRAIQLTTEAANNEAVAEQLREAKDLVHQAERSSERVEEQTAHKLRNFDRDLDDRLDYFVRGANSILTNMNAVTAAAGYGENLKKVEKTHVKKGE